MGETRNARLYEVGIALGLSQTTIRTIRNDKTFVVGAICIIILFFIILKAQQ